jgi:UDP-N-acetyl-D-mannosaminuronate dehydrogenase
MDEGLHTGSLWSTQIEQELEKCDVFLVLISPDVNQEETKEQDISFVRREIEQAKEDHKRIMVVLAQPAKIPLVLKGEQYIDLTRNHQAGIEKIIAELHRFQVSTSSGQIPNLHLQ